MAIGYFIREGDRTSCGGVVMTGDSRVVMNGMGHALEGDAVSCGKDGKIYWIKGGIRIINSHGRHPAGTLDSISTCPCRAQLINSLQHRYEKIDSPAPQIHRASANSPNRFANGAQANDSQPVPFVNPGTCNHPDRMEELATYIADEMNRNIHHPSVLEMKELNSYDPVAETREYMALPFYKRLGTQPDFHGFALAKKVKAFGLWVERVGQDRPWDHKPKIRSRVGGIWHKQGAYDYYYDIWSNIHYGYVGIISGLSESVLLDGAGAEQIISDTKRVIEDMFADEEDKKHPPGPHTTASPWTELRSWDDIADRVSISLGVKLAGNYPNGGVSPKLIMGEVLTISPEHWGKGVTAHECG